jgi:20S proteasome subunit beta 1
VRHYIDIQAIELGNFPPVESAAKIMKQIIYSNAGRLGASMMCSGWDPYKGYQIYSVNQTGFFTEGDFAMSGSGTVFIKGYFDANYNKNMSLEQAKEFLKSCISLACYRDSSSGGVIRLMSITEAAVERFFIPYQEFSIK